MPSVLACSGLAASVAKVTSAQESSHAQCAETASSDAESSSSEPPDLVALVRNKCALFDDSAGADCDAEGTKRCGSDVDSIASTSPGSSLLCIDCELPDGLAVANNCYGRCLVATKPFKEGQCVYSQCTTRGSAVEYLIRVKQGASVMTYSMDTVNSVKDVNSDLRKLYTFDGFTNHGCEPNVLSIDGDDTPESLSYDMVAVRDIDIGEEILVDYATFEYECDGHQIDKCLCGSSKCRGNMRGFKHLTLDEKIEIMPHADFALVEKFVAETPNLSFVDYTHCLPGSIDVVQHGDEWEMVAAKPIRAGELLFRNTSTVVTDEDFKFVVRLRDQATLAVAGKHFLHREGYMEFLGFDSFMQHSCDPNVVQTYVSMTDYEIHARRGIKLGETITCDYTTLHNLFTGAKLVPVMSFTCRCGSACCLGEIHC